MKSAPVTVDINEARAHLSKLVDRAARGEPFVIARAGKPLVTVSTFKAARAPQRFGFLAGEISVPVDFDRMGSELLGTVATTED